jgi:hypothetical protein
MITVSSKVFSYHIPSEICHSHAAYQWLFPSTTHRHIFRRNLPGIEIICADDRSAVYVLDIVSAEDVTIGTIPEDHSGVSRAKKAGPAAGSV